MKCTWIGALALLMAGGVSGAQSAKDLSDRGVKLLERGEYAAAESALRAAFDQAGAPLRGSIGNNLGVALYQQGRYREAETMFLGALAELEPNVTDFASGLMNLAAVYRRIGRLQDARLLAEDALRLLEEAYGRDSREVGKAWLSLAEVYRSTGDFPRAEVAASRAATILGREGFAGTLPHADALASHALALLALRRTEEAGSLAERSLEIQRRVLGPDDPRMATAIALLGNVRLLERRLEEAAAHFERALELWTRSGLQEHPNVAAWHNNLAQVYKLTDRYSEAAAMYRKALRIWERTVGREHAEYAMGLANFADLRRAEGKLGVSAQLYREAIAVLRSSMQPGSAAVVNAERALDEVERQASAKRAAYTVDYRDLKKR